MRIGFDAIIIGPIDVLTGPMISSSSSRWLNR